MNSDKNRCVVQNAENKKVVTLKDTKKQEKSSIFDISVEQLVASYDFFNIKYETTLAEDIIKLCNENGITTDGMFQQRTCVLRIQYSRLRGNKYHIPKKEILLSICIGLRLSIEEVTALMGKGGYSFTYNNEFEQENNLPSFDRLIHDCICMRIYDIDEINDYLINNGYKERLGSSSLI